MKRKEPGIPAVLSFFVPGLGQIYNGEFTKGFTTILLLMISWALAFIYIGIVFAAIIWVWSILDAYRTAEKNNLRLTNDN